MGNLGDQDSPGSTDRVSMGNRSSINIESIWINAKFAFYSDSDGGKGFIHLESIDLVNFPSGPLQGDWNGCDRSQPEHARLHARNSDAADRNQWQQTGFKRH